MQDYEQVGFVINLVARQFERQMAAALRPLDLTPAYLPVIISLSRDQPKTQAELATNLDIRQPTMAQTLSRMERDGLITRTPDDHDRRATSIMLTDKTMGLIGQIQDLASGIVDKAFEGLSPERRAQLVKDLNTVSRSLAQ